MPRLAGAAGSSSPWATPTTLTYAPVAPNVAPSANDSVRWISMEVMAAAAGAAATPAAERTKASEPTKRMHRLLEVGAADHPEVAPAADPQLLGALEGVDHRDVRVGIGEVRLHAADRQAQLLADVGQPRVVPAVRGHRRLAQVDLEEVHLLRLHPEHVPGVERVAAELECGGVGIGGARLPVDEREAALVGPEAEVGRDPDRRALEVEHLGPVLDRPVLGRRRADLREQRQPEEVAQARGDVAAERLPDLGLEVQRVFVLEQREGLGVVTIAAVARRAPVAAHALNDVGDERLHGHVAPGPEDVQRHLDRVVHDAPRPHLPRGELLEHVEAAHLLGGAGLPAAPGAVVVVEVPPLALREDVVATAGPGEVVGEGGHRSAFYASLGTMTTGTFIVECPCCQAKLTVDPEVRAVIAHEEPPRKRTVADLDTAFGALGAKAAEREERFRQARASEADKGKLLDRKFQEGLKKAKDSPDPPRRPFDYE